MDEDAFLRKLLDNPADDLVRLVYADWLDERETDDAKRKAEFLRLMPRLVTRSGMPSKRIPARARELAAGLDPTWLAVVSRGQIENCRVVMVEDIPRLRDEVKFDFRCPKKWEELTPTNDPKQRFCGSCKETVYFCETIREARIHALDRHCIVIDLAVRHNKDDAQNSVLDAHARFAGRPSRESFIRALDKQPMDPVSLARERQRRASETPPA